MRFIVVSLVALALLFAPMASRAQNAAQDEALRQRETAIALKQTLAEAQKLHKQRDLPAAAKLYEEVLGLVKKLGGANLAREQEAAMAGWANVRLLQALEEQRKGEFAKAADFAQKVLDVDPQHKDALDFKRFNVIVRDAHRGPLPSKEAVAKSLQYKKEREKIQVALRDGLLHFQIRMWPEAEEKFRDAIRLDPGNEVGFYYLKLINELRHDEAMRRRELSQLRPVEAMPLWDPSKSTMPPTPMQREKIQVALRDGLLHFQNRMWPEAEEKFRDAIRLDPNNEIGFYYLKLIQELRFDEAVRERELSQRRRVEAMPLWDPSKSTMPPTPKVYGSTNISVATPAGRFSHLMTSTSGERGEILEKLHSIIIPELYFDGWTLPEVVRYLDEEAKRNDPSPQKRGVNFIVNSPRKDTDQSEGNKAANQPAPTAIDPNTGLPIPSQTTVTNVDLNSVIIKIMPAIRELTLFQALDAIQKSADKGIRYSVENYAVVFTERNRHPEQLFTRTFRVNPEMFLSGLSNMWKHVVFVSNGDNRAGNRSESSGGGSSGGGLTIARVNSGGLAGGVSGSPAVTITNLTMEYNQIILGYFSAAGLNITNYGGSVFFTDRDGLLLVRATQSDLDIVAEAIEVLMTLPAEKLPPSRTKDGDTKVTDPKVNPLKSNESGKEPRSPDGKGKSPIKPD